MNWGGLKIVDNIDSFLFRSYITPKLEGKISPWVSSHTLTEKKIKKITSSDL